MQELFDVYDATRTKTGLVLPRKGSFLQEGQYMLYVLAILENQDGRVLITQRTLDKRWAAGWWEVPGGGAISGESSREAVTREVREETGIDVSDIDAEPVYSYENVDLERGDNYFVDIYHFHLDFTEDDVTLQASESIACRLATWQLISWLDEKGTFLHYSRLREALAAE